MFPGVDIVEIGRFGTTCERRPKIKERLFTERELKYLEGKGMASWAARFAAKEAVLKTFGTGLSGIKWHDVEIVNLKSGEPVVILSERAQSIAEQRGGTQVRLSLSHEKDYAIAMAILF